MFSKAIQWGYARENPVRQVKLFKENNAIVRNLTPQEKDRLLAYCSARIRPIVITALHTGMRKGEILNLTWSDVDLEKGIITVRDSKNHETRYIPIN
jgi:integrase